MMNIIKTDIKNMQDIAPLIDDDIIDQYNQKYRRYKRVKKPNFVNGLTEVKVNSAEDDYDYASRQGSREQSPSGRSENGNGNDLGNDLGNGNGNGNGNGTDRDHDRSRDRPMIELNTNTISGAAAVIIDNDAESVEPQNNIVVPAHTLQQLQHLQQSFHNSNANSPAHSIRSGASIQSSGQIRVDASGNSTLAA